MPGLVHRAPDWDALVGALAHRWHTDPLPPFGAETVIVSSPGAGRLLRQDLAHAIGEGICAGARFLTIGAFRRELDPVAGPDPWRRRALALAILEVLPGLLDDPAFALVAHHLGERGDPARPGRWVGFARRFAATLLSYATEQPDLLRAWSRGDETGPHGEVLGESRWQCLLWRALREAAPTPDPVSRHDLLLPRLGGMILPGRLQVVAPQPLPPLDAALLRALAQRPGLECYVVGDQDVPWLPGARLVQVPGRTRRPSLAVHVSHGTHRQIEVLRDALCGVFQDDPSLEPRDVVIQCADLPRYAPGIAAAFAPLPLGHAHPGRQLRVGLAAAPMRRGNDVALTLSELLRLPDSRARLDGLLGLAALPPVARRFGFTAESLARIGELAASAGVRWGIDAAHRARFGLEVSQNTWLAGLDRLLAGLVLPDDEAVWLGTLTP
ncbi:MAG: exodeoxyribonuclease V subunit gamma, partial [Propionibacteriaceae bacterium]|nr:exodeoxyribonuclease V subunit gamma [Propionibacteriaceae bacterium]